MVAGVLFPGWGFWGLGATILSLGAISLAGRKIRAPFLAILGGFAVLSIVANLHYQPPAAPAGWHEIVTNFGAFPNDRLGAFKRHQALIAEVQQSINAGNKVIILPEEVAGRWRPAAAYWWREVDRNAVKNDAVVLVGADLIDGVRFRDALVMLGSQHGQISSRQPIPSGLWRPWSKSSAIADWGQPGVARIAGKTAALSFCYEDLLLWPLLTSMRHRPTVVLSVANNWFGDGLDLPYIQAMSVALTSRAFGLPLVRALNR